MANLKTSMPKADTLAKIADYLNCSVDYLLGRTDNPEINKINDKKPLIIEEINTPTKKLLFCRFTELLRRPEQALYFLMKRLLSTPMLLKLKKPVQQILYLR